MQAKLNDIAAARSAAIGHLRAFVTLLVVLHHAVLPYTSAAPSSLRPFAEPPFLWAAFPVVDPHRFTGWDLVVGYNDTFFMSLMFFLSGLFVPGSLDRKGPATFLKDRARRLGVPFVLSAAVLAPLAYYPAFRQAGGGAGYLSTWAKLASWPAGPAWFLWVLLVLGATCALLAWIAPRFTDVLGRVGARLHRPAVFFAAVLAVTALAYVPLATLVDPDRWSSFGPFAVQTSRVLHYTAWFAFGLAIGANGVTRGLLAAKERLARRFWAWGIASVVTYLVEIVLVIMIYQHFMAGERPSGALLTAANVGFVVVCATTCLAFLGAFVRFARPSRVFDALSRNAYGMYLFHYVFVSYAAYALLGARFSGAGKGLLVFAVAAAGSFGLTAVLRRTRAGAWMLD